ncbi:phenol hydroxylase subunit P4 [Oceanobacter mangrovi]|uniref:phenol hydroxylase subunit P4 n=1 Tax=Oceanobacter mangrovi TaxID=2862510 RepID=UPI001C8EF977|nr:phenol hydroxylase subunit P4 [Oceanobacter mangrovi]
MAVNAIVPDYSGEIKDKFENFHGNQVVYVDWAAHRLFPAPMSWPLPPDMPFVALREQVMAGTFGIHPEWPEIDWSRVEWTLDGEAFTPDEQQGLAEQGIGHKSMLRFHTPGLSGFQNAGV